MNKICILSALLIVSKISVAMDNAMGEMGEQIVWNITNQPTQSENQALAMPNTSNAYSTIMMHNAFRNQAEYHIQHKEFLEAEITLVSWVAYCRQSGIHDPKIAINFGPMMRVFREMQQHRSGNLELYRDLKRLRTDNIRNIRPRTENPTIEELITQLNNMNTH